MSRNTTLTKEGLKGLERQVKRRDSDAQSRQSLRSLASSKYSDSYNVQKVFHGNRVPNETKQKLNQIYSQMDQGQISQQQFGTLVQKELGISTNPRFDRQLKNVNPSLVDVMKGIEPEQNIHRTNLKPNTVDDSNFDTKDKLGSLLKYQANRSEEIKYDPQTQSQKQCLESMGRLLNGEITQDRFVRNLREQGITEQEIRRNLKELECANSTSKSELGARMYRQLNYIESKENTNGIPYATSGYSPQRTKKHIFKPNNDLNQYNPEVISTLVEQDQRLQQQQVRRIDEGRIYNEIKGQGEFHENNDDNGQIITWQGQKTTIGDFLPEKKIQTYNKEMKVNVNLKLNDVKTPYQEPVKQKNLSQLQTTSTFMNQDQNIAQVRSPNKNISQLQGSGNIISWM